MALNAAAFMRGTEMGGPYEDGDEVKVWYKWCQPRSWASSRIVEFPSLAPSSPPTYGFELMRVGNKKNSILVFRPHVRPQTRWPSMWPSVAELQIDRDEQVF